jgi:acyl-CoA synthetase (AMP-forming)/AMP-acid ligase II
MADRRPAQPASAASLSNMPGDVMYPGDHAQDQPDKPAVIMNGSGEIVTYRQLDERSTQLARLLREAGLRPGDHVAMLMENNAHFLEITWAALRSGLYMTPINSYLTSEEAAYIIKDCGARAFIGSHAKRDVAAGLEGENAVPEVGLRLMVGGTIPGFEAYETSIAAHDTKHLEDESMGAFMMYSSGTTGRPKGIMRALTGEKPSDSLGPATMGLLFGWRKDMTYLSPAPLYHAAPIVFCNAALSFGGTVVVMEKFDAAEALRAIDRHGVTHSQWVPTMFNRMLKLPESERSAFSGSTLEKVIHAAAPCPVEIKRKMIEWWGPVIHEYYAGSEGNGVTLIDSEAWLKKPGSVGKPVGAEIDILDEEGRVLPPGEPGTVYFRGGATFEYHNDPEKTAESRAGGEGRSTLGDMGYLDEDGYLFLTDRKAYMIISGGVNIYPQEIEDTLITHPLVADAAVFGVPNSDMGEEVKAVVQLMPGVDESDATRETLLAHCREHLAGFKIPRSIDFEAELPRLPTGKLYKRLLRDRYWGNHETKIV